MAATSDHAKLAANTLQACNHIFVNAGFSEAQVPLLDHERRSATNTTLARVQIQLLRPVDDLSCMSLIIDGHVLDNLHFIRDMTDDGRLLFVWNGNAFFMDSDAIILHRASFTAPFFVRSPSYALPGAAAERWPCASFATSGAGLFATHVRCRWALHCDLDARRLLVGVVLLGPQDFPCRMWSDKGGASYTHILPPACTGICTFHALWLYPLAAHLCCAATAARSTHSAQSTKHTPAVHRMRRSTGVQMARQRRKRLRLHQCSRHGESARRTVRWLMPLPHKKRRLVRWRWTVRRRGSEWL